MKEFNNGEGVGRFLASSFSNTFDEGSRGMQIISNEILKDANEKGYAPLKTSNMINTSHTDSDFKKGLLIWNTVYARRRWFEGSKSGVEKWAEKSSSQNLKKYEDMLVDYLKKEL